MSTRDLETMRSIAVLALVAGALSAAAASTPKKPVVHRAARHGRSHSTASHLDPAQRSKLIEQIGARLKEPSPHAIAYGSALDGFYAQLALHEDDRRKGGIETGTVRVLQWGDSHTAADMFTGETRRLFQEQFGDGGIGYSYAGHPFPGYRIVGSSRAQSPGWKTQGNKFLALGNAELGMGGISISTDQPGEWVTLDTQCTTLDIEYLERPGGGSLRLTSNDGEPIEIQTNSTEIGPGTFHSNCTAGDDHFKITTADSAPVTLLGSVATRPGVTWESIGINGAEAPLILRWDQPLFSQYLKDNSPALIVLAYGTNEAASAHWDEKSYQHAFANVIETIHQDVPESSILVIGPSDRSALHHHVWRPYDGTDRIVAAQRAVCLSDGCAYWDQRERMGGLGAMQQWAAAGWAQPDHTHFTGAGYRALADALMADLMAAYQTYKQRHFPNTETAIRGATLGATHSNP